MPLKEKNMFENNGHIHVNRPEIAADNPMMSLLL